MAKQKNDDFFVGLKEPVVLRKGMLLSVKGMVEVLQRIELIKELRRDKSAAIEKLKTLTKEAAQTTISLRNKLPKPSKAMTDELKDFVRIEKKAEKDELIEPTDESVKEIRPQALTKLESELKEIEKELEKLG